MKKIKISTEYIILACFLSLITIFGESYKVSNSWDLIFDHIIISIVKFVVFSLIIYFFIYLIDKLFNRKDKKCKNKVLMFLFDKHIILTLLIVLLFWLPFLILKYPGSPGWDFHWMMLHYYTNKLTQHFPLFYVNFCALFINIGIKINNINLMLFILTIIHMCFFLLMVYLIFKYLKKWNTNYIYRLFILLFLCLNQVFLNYSSTIYHDTIYSPIMVIYMLTLTDIVFNKNLSNKKSFITSSIAALFICLTRKNGIYIVLPTAIYIFIKYILHSKKKLSNCLILFLPFVLFSLFENIYSARFWKTSPGEYLAISLQGIGRYSRDYHDDITKKQLKAINKIVEYNSAGLIYYPTNVDSIKNNIFNYDCTKHEIINFFKAWIQLFNKHPDAFIEAAINNTYLLYYPFENNTRYFTETNTEKLNNGLNFSPGNQKNKALLERINYYLSEMPIIKYLDEAGIYIWLMFVLVLIALKNKLNMLPLIPNIMTFLCCLAGPTMLYNTRYAFPIMFSTPFLYIFYKTIKNNKKKTLIKH